MTWKTTNTAKGDNKLYSDARGVVPSLDLRFASQKNFNDYITGTPLVDHQRSMSSSNLSPGTFVNSNGLVEASKANLFTYSQDTTQSDWSKPRSSHSIGGIAPDGNNTANDVTVITTGFNGFVAQNKTISGTYTYSAFVKKKGFSTFRIGFTVNASENIYWNIDTDTFSNQGSNVIDKSSQSFPNGWYRISVTYNITVSTTYGIQIFVVDNPGNTFTTVNGTDGFYLWGAQLEEGSTATTYIPTTNVPSAAPRFDHDPTTGESLGLLVEEGRTNELSRSEDFTDPIWPASSTATITTSTGIDDPKGTNTAATITNVSGPNLHRLISGTAGITYTYSIWIRRRNGSGPIYLTVGDNILQEVTVTNTWTRVSATNTPTSTVVRAYVLIGSTGDSIDVWGAQVEAGSFPTSYIPTTGTALTRSADAASITGTNFSSWYRQDEATVFAEVDSVMAAGAANTRILQVGDGTSANRQDLAFSSGTLLAFVNTANVVQVNAATTNSAQANTNTQLVYAYAQDDFAWGLDAGTIKDDLTGTPPTVNALGIGQRLDTNGFLNGHVKRLTYFPERLPDTSLQAMTS